eukprot:334336_1
MMSNNKLLPSNKRRKIVASRIRNASDIKLKTSLYNQGIELNCDITNVIKNEIKRIRGFEDKSIKKLKRKLHKQRKLHTISLSNSLSKMAKKLACLPIREIEDKILQFNGDELCNYGFEWKLIIDYNKGYKYKKLCINNWINPNKTFNNIILDGEYIINTFIQSFIYGSLCMKYNNKYKDLGIPNKNYILDNECINITTMSNLLLRVQYQSLKINITNVNFDLFARNNINKYGYLTIKPLLHKYVKHQKLWNILFQSHDTFVILKNKNNNKQIFFGIAQFDKKINNIKIKVHHKTIGMYDVYNWNQEWMLYAAPYCVKHTLMTLYQIYIDKQNQ